MFGTKVENIFTVQDAFVGSSLNPMSFEQSIGSFAGRFAVACHQVDAIIILFATVDGEEEPTGIAELFAQVIIPRALFCADIVHKQGTTNDLLISQPAFVKMAEERKQTILKVVHAPLFAGFFRNGLIVFLDQTAVGLDGYSVPNSPAGSAVIGFALTFIALNESNKLEDVLG